MSTGHGKLQRDLLGTINANDALMDTFALTAMVFAPPPYDQISQDVTESQLSSVRRALHKLAREGHIVFVGRGWHDRRARWANKKAAADHKERLAKLPAY